MNSIKKISFVLSILILSGTVGFVFAAWQDPTAPPPDENVSAPINVGATSQTKAGPLIISGGLTVNADITANRLVDTSDVNYYVDPANTGYAGLFAGSVGIGTITPSEKLDVAGAIKIGNTASACDASHRGAIKFASAGAGAVDTWQICRKSATDEYGWVTISLGLPLPYTYRKPVTINNAGGALTDYQVKVTNPIYDETGLVGSWHMDGTVGAIANGTIIPDSSGNSNNGTAFNANGTGMAYATGKHGQGINFDGTDDHVKIGNAASLNITSAITIEAWVKRNGIGTYQGVVDRYDDGAPNIRSWRMMFYPDNALYFSICKSATLCSEHNTVVAYTSTTQWYHIVGVYKYVTDGTSLMDIYVNGEKPNAQKTNANGPLYAPTIDVSIGAGRQGAAAYFNGTIDEVRIYNRALLAAEIQAHYEAKAKLNYGDIRFTDSDGSTELAHWAEKDGTYWVKVPSVPAGAKTIYVYYGNPSASSASNGTNTFESGGFDDFETGTEPDSGKWNQVETSGGNVSLSSGKLVCTPGTTAAARGLVYSISTFSYPRVLEFRANFNLFLDNTYGIGGFADNTADAGNTYDNAVLARDSGGPPGETLIGHSVERSGNSASGSYWGSYTGASYSNFKINWISDTQSEVYEDTGSGWISRSTLTSANTPNNAIPVKFGAYNWSGGGPSGTQYQYFDWVRVRKYASPEPTTEVGAEEY